jgi:hypothetical protein
MQSLMICGVLAECHGPQLFKNRPHPQPNPVSIWRRALLVACHDADGCEQESGRPCMNNEHHKGQSRHPLFTISAMRRAQNAMRLHGAIWFNFAVSTRISLPIVLTVLGQR